MSDSGSFEVAVGSKSDASDPIPDDAPREVRPMPEAAVVGPDPSLRALDGAGLDNLLQRYLSLPAIRVTSRPPSAGLGDELAPRMSSPPTAESFKKFNERLIALEPLLQRGRWEEIRATLESEGELPPPLALIYAIAQKELGTPDTHPEQVAIEAMAAILGVQPSSSAAVFVAKRVLRKNPVGWRKQRASAKTSALLIAIVTLLGLGVGYLLSPGTPLGLW